CSSFATSWVGASGPTAEMCGTTAAASLANVAAPSNIAVGGKFACDEVYNTGTNSLLDAIVRGCSIQGNFILNPTQPDSQDPSASFPSGTKAPYKLQTNGATHVIDACVDSSSTPQSVPLATCLSGLGYTSAFTYQTDRVIVHH
ncbi:MAG TPA: hypothetical protein VKU41_02105, partial [Polyangiaceae bacterium]|nr:hypothetical protein [Polyangiaceae bacterium]